MGKGLVGCWAAQEHGVSYFSQPANPERGGGRGHTWEAWPDGRWVRGVPRRGADLSLAHLGGEGEA